MELVFYSLTLKISTSLVCPTSLLWTQINQRIGLKPTTTRQRHHQPPPQQQQQPSPFPSRWSVSPPSQHQSPGEQQRTQVPSQPTKQHRSWPIPINPLPASPSLTNNHHVDQYQVTGHNSQYPYPPPELRYKSPTMIDDDAWLRPTPHSERRRAGKVSRRKAN